MPDEQKTTKHSGYVYNSKTKAGFQRMKRQGIVMPPFRIEDSVTRLLTGHYDRLLTKMAQAIKSVRMMEKVTIDSKYRQTKRLVAGNLTTDGLYQEIMGQLQDAILRSVGSDKEKLEKKLRFFLKASQDHFFENFLEDADEKVRLRVEFALDKDEVFQQRMSFLIQDYLDVSLKRITWEENHLKNEFLRQLTDFALGNSPDLESIKAVMEKMKETSVREARFFARDQFARLNKSLTLASFSQAEVKMVQWLTVGDGRVRPTHKALNRKYFPMNNLPEEMHDYNCRCAMVPVWSD